METVAAAAALPATEAAYNHSKSSSPCEVTQHIARNDLPINGFELGGGGGGGNVRF
jgi:hypothetical protein